MRKKRREQKWGAHRRTAASLIHTSSRVRLSAASHLREGLEPPPTGTTFSAGRGGIGSLCTAREKHESIRDLYERWQRDTADIGGWSRVTGRARVQETEDKRRVWAKEVALQPQPFT